MITKRNIAKQFQHFFVTIFLVICILVSNFSSLLAIHINEFGETIDSTITSQNLNHFKPITGKSLLAELIDAKEEELSNYKKNKTGLDSVIRILWTSSISALVFENFPSAFNQYGIPHKEPSYIEFCSLRIPLIS